MKEIKLNRNFIAFVDDEDYDRVMEHTWCVTTNRVKSKESHYAITNLYEKGIKSTLTMHEFILGKVEGLEIDHWDTNTLNNQKTNLRHLTHRNNCRNTPKRADTTSKYKGVSWNKGHKKYKAYISPNEKMIHLGYFDDPIEAAEIYNTAATLHFGEYAHLNVLEATFKN